MHGLGAPGRQAARARVDGVLVAACGLASGCALLWTIADPPTAASGGPAVATSTSIRPGVVLALVVACAIAALGALIARQAARRQAPARPRSDSPPRPQRTGRTGRTGRHPADPPMPDFDFRVDGVSRSAR